MFNFMNLFMNSISLIVRLLCQLLKVHLYLDQVTLLTLLLSLKMIKLFLIWLFV